MILGNKDKMPAFNFEAIAAPSSISLNINFLKIIWHELWIINKIPPWGDPCYFLHKKILSVEFVIYDVIETVRNANLTLPPCVSNYEIQYGVWFIHPRLYSHINLCILRLKDLSVKRTLPIFPNLYSRSPTKCVSDSNLIVQITNSSGILDRSSLVVAKADPDGHPYHLQYAKALEWS